MEGSQMFARATQNPEIQVFDSLALFLARIGAVFAGAQAANRLYHHLSRLPDSELAARGLTREDIGRMVFQALSHATRD